MNTENIIEFIRRSHALKCTKKSYWAEIFYFLLFSVLMLAAGIGVEGILKVIGVASCVCYIVHTAFVIFLIRKTSPLKNKFIVGFTSTCCMLCLAAFLFTVFYVIFNMPEKVFGYYFVFLALIPIFLSLFYYFRLNSPKPLFSKKTSIKIVPLFSDRGRMALGTLILGGLYKCFGSFISESVFEKIVIYALLFIMYALSFNLLDLQRYYYYTKLEKMGLVTEDILKPLS